ncbi:hypothetical protein DPR00_31620 [Burkholderia pseudomallei]|nr:hypothetical protein DPQ97_32745 [Burkholderia pseudomallei]RAP80888.1 hypothetical protein DPR01_33340 [Burkholderia pseudomallei]RAP86684.1 hypothetical protein DPQ99_31560 [Burkholderia pseudomallei]RAQ10552.1 hypothetical protein DPR00_31620 [Burkholderia pseudomallei]
MRLRLRLRLRLRMQVQIVDRGAAGASHCLRPSRAERRCLRHFGARRSAEKATERRSAARMRFSTSRRFHRPDGAIGARATCAPPPLPRARHKRLAALGTFFI